MKYVTPYKYAKLCGVSPQAIYYRISTKLLEVVQIPDPSGDLKDYIDIEKYPPERIRKSGSLK